MVSFRPFALERWFAAHEHTTAHQLSASDCEPLRVGELLARCGEDPGSLLDVRLHYTETRGAPALRTAIADRYPGCGADDVLVGGAPQEAIALLFQALLEPGQRVVVQTPCYQSLIDLPRRAGCEVMGWPLRRDGDGFAIDWEALPPLLAARPQLVVTNFPHNPTGLQPTPDEWQRLAQAIEASGARWFSDEMYRGLAPSPARDLPPAASLSARAISLWGLSKSFGLPGLRLGWLVARDRGLLAAVEARKDFTSICSNALAEHLAVRALRRADDLLAGNRARIAANGAAMAAFAARPAATLAWCPPQAGPVGLARLRRGSATEFAERALRHDALLVSSPLFDLPDEWLRIGLGRAPFAAALTAFDQSLTEWATG